MVYQWTQGYRAKVKAQVAGERIESLRQSHGGNVTPEIVLEDARDESSPLHPAFEWDDEKAAENFRREQATRLLISIVVKVDEAPQTEPTRAFVNVVKQNTGSVFTSIQDAMREPGMREQVLGRARSELASWRKRYAAYQELARVFEVVDEVIQSGEPVAA